MVDKTLIIEGNEERAKQYAHSMHGESVSTHCVFATTNNEGRRHLLNDPKIICVVFHGSIFERAQAILLFRRLIRQKA